MLTGLLVQVDNGTNGRRLRPLIFQSWPKKTANTRKEKRDVTETDKSNDCEQFIESVQKDGNLPLQGGGHFLIFGAANEGWSGGLVLVLPQLCPFIVLLHLCSKTIRGLLLKFFFPCCFKQTKSNVCVAHIKFEASRGRSLPNTNRIVSTMEPIP